MTSGLPNDEKAKVRQLYAEGKVGRDELLEAEAESYHGRGTCTFYGTANSNQMLMEIMGLHLPGAAFVNPDTPLRDALTREAGRRALAITALGNDYTPVGQRRSTSAPSSTASSACIATGGSTNHTIHLIAMAARGRHQARPGRTSPTSRQSCRCWPASIRTALADVNHFHAAGGMGFLIRELLDAGLLHEDVQTVWRRGPAPLHDRAAARRRAACAGSRRRRRAATSKVLRPVDEPFQPTGGLKVLVRQSRPRRHQDLGRRSPSAASSSAARSGLRQPGGAARRLQGRRARPRLHRRRPLPGAEGQRHAGTAQADARARRAAGSRPQGGAGDRRPHVGRLRQGAGGDPCDAGGRGGRADGARRDGDIIRLDADAGTLTAHIGDDEFANRIPTGRPPTPDEWVGTGRELFASMRAAVGPADEGATVFRNPS